MNVIRMSCLDVVAGIMVVATVFGMVHGQKRERP